MSEVAGGAGGVAKSLSEKIMDTVAAEEASKETARLATVQVEAMTGVLRGSAPKPRLRTKAEQLSARKAKNRRRGKIGRASRARNR